MERDATWCAPGPLLVTAGAALFAGVNATSTALYRRGNVSVVVLYILRSAIMYIANAIIVALRDGSEAASNILLLRTGNLCLAHSRCLAHAQSVVRRSKCALHTGSARRDLREKEVVQGCICVRANRNPRSSHVQVWSKAQ